MPLITFIPIPTKFVGAGFPADVYISVIMRAQYIVVVRARTPNTTDGLARL